jgi:16S rRNA (cytosine967-C5)-methyltransferase
VQEKAGNSLDGAIRWQLAHCAIQAVAVAAQSMKECTMEYSLPPPDSLAAAFVAAAEVVAIVIEGRSLDVALAAMREEQNLQHGAIQDLAYGALRQYGRGDFVLAQLCSRPLTEPRIRALLLAALYRLEARPEDAHTTVNQAVTAASGVSRGRYKALVNGVLRNYQRRQAELELLVAGDDEARWRTPRWWIAKLRAAYPEQWQEILLAGNGHPPMTLRVNRRRLERLAGVGIEARPLDDTAVLLSKAQPVTKLPGFFDGLVSVQDWGAQRAAALLDAHPGMVVLDACAAPGGKTAHLLERADIEVLALEVDAGRARRIAENLDRLDLRAAATVKVADARHIKAWWDGRPFARILADVPCTASGVVRRHPDSKWLRRPADVAGFVRSQTQIVDALWQTLAPGGKMLYCTCSLFAEENDEQVAGFASRHADALRLPTGSGNAQYLQLTPRAEHDGFYYALLQKKAT